MTDDKCAGRQTRGGTGARNARPHRSAKRCGRDNARTGCATLSHPCHLSWRFAQVRQLSPIAAGVDPDGAIGTKGDYLAGCQRGDLLDLAGSERWG
jgi:hypothetical protein